MKNHEHFWWVTLVRGFIALLAGSAIMVIPDMARTLLLLPLALAMSILGLAVYGVLDSVLVFITSYMAGSRRSCIALRIQGVVGVAIGILMYVVFFDQVRLHWFLLLVALQSLATAIAEFTVARHAQTPGTSRWNYAGATVAFAFSCIYTYIALALAPSLLPHEITWFIYAYLLTFGISQCLTAARMIYTGHHPRPTIPG